MPGTVTVSAANQNFTPLALTTSEDTYTITAGRAFTRTAPLTLRIVGDNAGVLIGYKTGGPYFFQPSTWANDYRFTIDAGSVLTLFVKANTGTPTLYITTVDNGN